MPVYLLITQCDLTLHTLLNIYLNEVVSKLPHFTLHPATIMLSIAPLKGVPEF